MPQRSVWRHLILRGRTSLESSVYLPATLNGCLISSPYGARILRRGLELGESKTSESAEEERTGTGFAAS
ncbi:hypothetical protein VTO73DRAFT_5836 [Trametes versicolor]